jgi:death-on-curing protein
VSIEYVDLVDYIAIAAEVTGLDAETIIRLPNLPLAESALHAPAAGFGEQDFYPDFIDKAAVLITRLGANRQLATRPSRRTATALAHTESVGSFPGAELCWEANRRAEAAEMMGIQHDPGSRYSRIWASHEPEHRRRRTTRCRAQSLPVTRRRRLPT